MMIRSTVFAVCLVLVLLATAPPGARADDKGDAVLRQAFATLHAARTYSANFSSASKMGDQAGPALKGKMTAMKPNYLKLELEGNQTMTTVSDGKSLFGYTTGTPYYFKQPVPPKPTELPGNWEGEIDSFFGGAANVAKVETTYAGEETVAGVPCAIVKAQMHSPDRMATYAVGKSDHLIRRMALTTPGPNGVEITMTNTLSNIRLNVPLTAAAFVFTPPKTAKLYQPPDYNAKLVKVGQDAPNFTLPTPAGGQVILESTLRGKKAVLVNFWFYNWGACRAEFPHLQKLYSELKDKGVELVAINHRDSADVINKYVAENKFTFLIGMGGDPGGKDYGIFEQYGVQAYPTNYVLDENGKVVWRGVGFQEEAIRGALEKLGVK